MKQQAEIFGIDLGTTNSCIAYADEHGSAVVVPNYEGELTTPSVVQFEGEQRIVGKEARQYALLYPDLVVERVKHWMGKPGKGHPYQGKTYTPEEISSYILRKLASDAQAYLNRPVRDVVITCPAYFGIAQREATIKAGELAGLTVHEVINEPTAAAMLYGLLSSPKDQVAIVYDLGGGTFDVTIIEVRNNALTVVATDGESELGGYRWDVKLVEYLDNQWMLETGSNESPASSGEMSLELLRLAEEAKKSLSVRQKTPVMINYTGSRVVIEVTRERFQALTASLLQRTIDVTKATMDAARAHGVKRFDQILLVGGSTRMPQVREQLEAEFHLPIQILEPDLAVAKGAALYGQKLLVDEVVERKVGQQRGVSSLAKNGMPVLVESKREAVRQAASEMQRDIAVVAKAAELQVVNVASHSFGVVATDMRLRKQVISNIVLVNEPLPVKKTRIYRTAEEYQANVEIQVLENSSSEARVEDLMQGEEIAYAILRLPPRLPQYSPIEVSFELLRDGRLQITSREPKSGVSIEVEIQAKRSITGNAFRQAKERASKITVV
ncbi:molecular chaperone DnaK [Ktedonobacter sp. SOSP1-85]|uniref:Hsp70 family protein n=1 Tax=Ktedonobacter sp. SOSP1-85 TaxID=2778367 RepID=UPI0019151304|nr:Hsp70 family protein [Ktedonobacter sp. SOSP1-85]GHO79958.1 molecular chaperone DnaK [Ktedonobacter sp. SOSP1-85]